MKNPADELQTAIYTALNGQITFDGSTVPVYDKTPNRPWNTAKTYDVWVQIDTPVMTPFAGTKDRFISNFVANINILALYEPNSNAGGQKVVNLISDQIMSLLIQRGGSTLSLNNFTIIAQQLQDFTPIEGIEQDYAYFGGNVRINYIIEQNA